MHKQCKNNAKPIPKKMHRKRKNKSPKDALECQKDAKKKKRKKCICPLNQCKKRTTNAKKTCTKNATKMHKKCNQKAKHMRSNTFWSLPLHFFLCICVFFLRKRKKNRKTSTNNAQKMQKTHATTSHKKCKKIAQKKWCVKFGCACACFLLFLNCCSAFFLLFFSGILFACFLLFDMHSF